MRILSLILLSAITLSSQNHITKSETITIPKGGRFIVKFAQAYPMTGPVPHCTFLNNKTARAWAITREGFEILEREGTKVTYSCTVER